MYYVTFKIQQKVSCIYILFRIRQQLNKQHRSFHFYQGKFRKCYIEAKDRQLNKISFLWHTLACIDALRIFISVQNNEGMKLMCPIANICNAGITADHVAEASAQACPSVPSRPWSSLHRGFGA